MIDDSVKLVLVAILFSLSMGMLAFIVGIARTSPTKTLVSECTEDDPRHQSRLFMFKAHHDDTKPLYCLEKWEVDQTLEKIEVDNETRMEVRPSGRWVVDYDSCGYDRNAATKVCLGK